MGAWRKLWQGQRARAFEVAVNAVSAADQQVIRDEIYRLVETGASFAEGKSALTLFVGRLREARQGG